MKTKVGVKCGWMRTVAVLAFALVALPAVAQEIVNVDFTATPQRQAPGDPVAFEDLSQPEEPILPPGPDGGGYLWDFGDNSTGPERFERDPEHIYSTPGLYDVTLTVRTEDFEFQLTREDFIEILDPPFADFVGVPQQGIPPLTVQFQDTSRAASDQTVVSWRWDFGDDTPIATRQNPQHTYAEAGEYTVTLTVTFSDGTTATVTKEAYIVVEESEEPEASFDAEIAIRDQHSLVPLMDWVPLLKFNLSYNDPGFRYLASMSYTITADQNPNDMPYDRGSGPDVQDLLDFAIFEVYDEDAVDLESGGAMIVQWDNTGAPVGDVVGGRGALTYRLDFIGTGSNARPQFPVGAHSDESGVHYVLAVRTSALWHAPWTMGITLNSARMVAPNTFTPEDNYPEFPVTAEVGYVSSFSALDWSPLVNGDASTDGQRYYQGNSWNRPEFLYTPLAEHSRPRWDLPGSAFEFVTGEWLGLRQLFPVEYWVPLVGINAHSTGAYHTDDPIRPTDPDYTWIIDGVPQASIREVNMVFTDIGGKPGMGPGSGGFDPRTQLDQMTGYTTTDPRDGGNLHKAVGEDYSFNGVWVFHDTNNNGRFDPPVWLEGGGVEFTGDFPMVPDFNRDTGVPGQNNPFLARWSYVPVPPGGGDPWWRITMRFSGDRRRQNSDDNPPGYLEPTPDRVGIASSFDTVDYFVVMRADSGYIDSSLRPGDGNGYIPGADFRALIEPRHFDPEQGHWRGGILIDSMIPGAGQQVEDRVITAWQDDVRWLQDEPWWTERVTSIESSKPWRGGFELHDYVILYNTNNDFARHTDINYADTTYWSGNSTWDLWMDPAGSRRQHFYYGFDSIFRYGDSPVLQLWSSVQLGNLFGAPYLVDDQFVFGYPFETAPFYNPVYDGDVVGPRSPVYIRPPDQPTLPEYSTWPQNLAPGRYPSIFDWAPEHRKARLLKQRIDIGSIPTPMMGINLVGANDPITNRLNARYLNEFYIAFWGPDFTPNDLRPLDPTGVSSTSGVQIREDSGDGAYLSLFDQFGVDAPLRLKDLRWGRSPERVDLDGDGQPDDINGDGIVNGADVAWVLRVTPATPWRLPSSDEQYVPASTGGGTGGDGGTGGTGGNPGGGLGGGGDDDEEVIGPGHFIVSIGVGNSSKALKSLAGNPGINGSPSEDGDVAAEAVATTKAVSGFGKPGEDLFVVVQTSNTLKRFEQFRVFMPATLPDRPVNERQAGFRMTPGLQMTADALEKSNPDENIVQDYFFHDMIEANVPVSLVDLTASDQRVTPNSEPLAMIGIDVSTNRGAAGTAASGSTGIGAPNLFTVSGAGWTPGAFAGYFLLDRNYEAFEIVGNTETQLNLLSGTPANGRWRILRDPTFLEQIIVELYDVGGDGQFNILEDLKPLDIDQRLSGVAIYRDNDADPSNRNGEFDPGIDIPITLDDAPILTGEVGEAPTQVKFVFSSPGTDDVPVPKNQQPRLRQWVPDTFGDTGVTEDAGPDFFVVVRTSDRISAGDDFTMGLVAWGPSTPTQPDPDTFTGPNVPLTHKDDESMFVEFPWGSRALGFITFFQTPPDNSGFNWIRTSAAKNLQTRAVTATSSTTVNTLTIESVQPAIIPTQIPAAGITLTITGSNFGAAPQVFLDGQSYPVTSASDTTITVQIPGGTAFDEGPVVVMVRDNARGRVADDDELLVALAGDVPEAPEILHINPSTGNEQAFPVTITGRRFESPEVFFGGTKMPIVEGSVTDTQIKVAFPPGGFALTGPLDVEVRSTFEIGDSKLTLKAIKRNGFLYTNPPSRQCFIATAAYGTPFEKHLDTFRAFRDGVLLKTELGTAMVNAYYRTSPAIADQVAAHPWLAVLVRGVLTPVAWLLETPGLLATPAGLALMAAWLRRRRTIRAR